MAVRSSIKKKAKKAKKPKTTNAITSVDTKVNLAAAHPYCRGTVNYSYSRAKLKNVAQVFTFVWLLALEQSRHWAGDH
jgi:hypothetical protein